MLGDGEIHLVTALFLQRSVSHVGDHPNDTPFVVAEHQYLANRILAGPNRPRHDLVDHDGWFRIHGIVGAEVTPRQQGDLHGLEVAAVHQARECSGLLAPLVDHTLGAGSPAPIPPQRKRVAHANGDNAGKRLDLARETLVVDQLVRQIFEFPTRLYPPCRDTLRLEAEVDIEHR